LVKFTYIEFAWSIMVLFVIILAVVYTSDHPFKRESFIFQIYQVTFNSFVSLCAYFCYETAIKTLYRIKLYLNLVNVILFAFLIAAYLI